MNTEFVSFGKIPRYRRECVITEKIDGTNAQVFITFEEPKNYQPVAVVLTEVGPASIYAGSRTRYITPDNDNFGFAAWVQVNAMELVKLGPGRHYGEWWGRGINSGYGLDTRVFSLFNTNRWNETNVPECCSVVPVITSGIMDDELVDTALCTLSMHGSKAAPGFMHPEGVVVYHVAGCNYFKILLHNDAEAKGASGL